MAQLLPTWGEAKGPWRSNQGTLQRLYPGENGGCASGQRLSLGGRMGKRFNSGHVTQSSPVMNLSDRPSPSQR